MENTHRVKTVRRVLGFVLLVTIVFSSVATPASAQTTYGGGSVQGYGAEQPIDVGTIVQLSGEGADKVKVAQQSELQNMYGVAVDRSQLLVSASNGNLQNETFVATSGTYNVLVSDQNGPIAVGDYVTLSSINGIAMKSSTDFETIFGRATQLYDGTGITLGTAQIKDTSGNVTKTVKLGSIPVTVDIKHNPDVKTTEANLPEFLRRVGLAVAEKEVSPLRMYLSIAILIASIIATIAMIYAGVRNSVISIGRNPMSKKSIFKALVQVILTGMLILIIGLFAVYLLLKL